MPRLTSLVVLSGVGGAGKSAALAALEDLGYYCIDNLPPALMPTFVDLCDRAGGAVARAALVVDARTHGVSEEFAAVWQALRTRSQSVELVFLDADDAVLQRRFSETRRPHALATDGDLLTGIRRERALLEPVRALASSVIDTSSFTAYDLRRHMANSFGQGADVRASVRVMSFAFRNGIPNNADIVLDVRFLSNPNYVADLKPLTGLDKAVSEYVESRPETGEFLNHVEGLLQFIMPRLVSEGRAYVTIAFGCTGGQHRSVALAARVADDLRASGYDVSVAHRDLPATPVDSHKTQESS